MRRYPYSVPGSGERSTTRMYNQMHLSMPSLHGSSTWLLSAMSSKRVI